EAAGARRIASRLNRSRGSGKSWSKIASTCSTSFISRNRRRDLNTFTRGFMKQHAGFHRFIFLFILLSFFVLTPTRALAQPETLTIGAANSLRDALRTLLPAFESQHPELTVRVIYGPSQSLRKQIEEGAPVDVFLPSLAEEIDQLEKKGLVIQGTKRIYAGTSLVLITSPVLPAPVRSIEHLHSFPSL